MVHQKVNCPGKNHSSQNDQYSKINLTFKFFLPNPSHKLLKRINDTLFKFIWQNKPDKLKRDLITQEYQDGGIKMINITNCIAALKATWIRRVQNGILYSKFQQVSQ